MKVCVSRSICRSSYSKEAQSLLGLESMSDTVVLALCDLVRRKRIDELRALLGAVTLEVDTAVSRRRPCR